MLQRNGQIPNGTILHQMVHSTSTRTRTSNKKRTISESSSSESEGNNRLIVFTLKHLLLIQSLNPHQLSLIMKIN